MLIKTKLQARYTQRGPNPEAVIEAVPFEVPELKAGEVLV
jgi:trans-2-enoyl-CoA reductase